MSYRPQYNFVDMRGKRVGKLIVLRRAANAAGGNSRWICRCACGRELIAEGIQLRQAQERSPNYCCKDCRAKRSGTVTRRARK